MFQQHRVILKQLIIERTHCTALAYVNITCYCMSSFSSNWVVWECLLPFPLPSCCGVSVFSHVCRSPYLVCLHLTNSLYFIKNDRLMESCPYVCPSNNAAINLWRFMKVGMNKRWDSSINIVTMLGLNDGGNQVQFLVEIFFSSTQHPAWSWDHSASYSVCSFPIDNAAGAWHWPLTST
jgi:hypothetical protein